VNAFAAENFRTLTKCFRDLTILIATRAAQMRQLPKKIPTLDAPKLFAAGNFETLSK
jgi:hypothetical protein